MWPNQTLQATAVKRLGWQVGGQRPAVPELTLDLIVSAPRTDIRIPARAAAAVVFAGFALLLWRDYFNVHYTILGRLHSFVADPVQEQLHFLERDLYVAFRGLSAATLVWCVLAWRSAEPRGAVVISIAFTALVLAINLWMFL